jgi:hypothetical protein
VTAFKSGERRTLKDVRLDASEAVRRFVSDHGGTLYVRATSSRCCTGALTMLDATTDRPADLTDYRRLEDGDLVVFVHFPGARRPDELVLTLEGRRRPRPRAFWNGAALVL